MKLYQIKENPLIKCNKEIKEYLDADYIYIPYDKDYELKIKNHELVNLNSVILTNKDKKDKILSILSQSTSMTLSKFKELTSYGIDIYLDIAYPDSFNINLSDIIQISRLLYSSNNIPLEVEQY